MAFDFGTWWSNLTTTVTKDEQWVITEISKGWAALQTAEQTAEVDILGIFQWIQTHQQSILALFSTVLNDLALVGTLIPQTAPSVAAATVAIDAATAAINVLSQGIQQGATPLSTAVNAYQAVKNAQSAVNAVLVAKTTQPATS